MFSTYIDAFNDIMFWVLGFLLLWNAYILVFNKGVPNVRTAPAIRKKVIKELIAQKGDKKKFHVIDTGCGNGLFTREIAKAIPDAQVIGIDCDKVALFWANFWKKLLRIKNVKYICEDFYAYDLSEMDAVVLYLTKYDMARMGKKFNNELKNGAKIYCNRFELKDNWSPQIIHNIKTKYPLQGKLHVYQKGLKA